MSYFRPYKYTKDEPEHPIYSSVSKRFFLNVVGYPTVLAALGIFFLFTQILVPLISFKTQNNVTRPVSSSVLGVATGFSEFEFDELSSKRERTLKAKTPDYYYLSIPKLNIEDAKVETFPSDLNPDKALGHYTGSSLPGENGNSFIYGHSVLPAFYNPKNYKTIFSTLHNLSAGDKFYITYNNEKYEYIIEDKEVLKSEEVDPLKNKDSNNSTITLMTCYPPGTKAKRLLINAKLVN